MVPPRGGWNISHFPHFEEIKKVFGETTAVKQGKGISLLKPTPKPQMHHNNNNNKAGTAAFFWSYSQKVPKKAFSALNTSFSQY